MRVFSIVTLLGLGIVASGPSVQPEGKRELLPSITVVGSGEVGAKPDMAQIQVGVVTQAPSAAKALADNNEAMDKLFKTLAERGIRDKDIQTSNFSVSPQYRQPQPGQPQQEIVGYQVSNQVAVKVRQLQTLGKVLDDLVTKGANQVHGITFSVAEPESLLDQARLKAIADARRKADLYARAARTKLGRVLLIEEATPRVPRPVGFGMAMERAAAVPVAPGEQEYHASITVTYALD
jgi:uncharacterized protein